MNFEATKSITQFLGVILLLGLCAFPLAADLGTTPVVQQPDQAGTALQQGRRLLKRGKSDQALGQLQTAPNPPNRLPTFDAAPSGFLTTICP